MPPALEAQSLNHWTTREALATFNSQGTVFVFSLRTQTFPSSFLAVKFHPISSTRLQASGNLSNLAL